MYVIPRLYPFPGISTYYFPATVLLPVLNGWAVGGTSTRARTVLVRVAGSRSHFLPVIFFCRLLVCPAGPVTCGGSRVVCHQLPLCLMSRIPYCSDYSYSSREATRRGFCTRTNTRTSLHGTVQYGPTFTFYFSIILKNNAASLTESRRSEFRQTLTTACVQRRPARSVSKQDRCFIL